MRCPAGWPSSTTTSRRPSISSACTRTSSSSVSGRRELTAVIDALRSRARRLRVQPPGARGARLSRHRRPAGRARLQRTSTAGQRSLAAGFDDEWTNVMFVGRVIPNKKFEDVIRAFPRLSHAYNPRSRLLLVGSYSGFETLPGDAARARREARHARRPLPRPRLERGADRALRRRRPLPLRQRARRASACRSSRRSTSACRSSPTRPPPCRRPWTAAACSTTARIREIAALMDAVLERPATRRRVVAAQDAALDRLRAPRLRRHAAAVRRRGAAAAPAPAPDVALDFWAQFEQASELEELVTSTGRRSLPRAAERRPGGSR